MLMGDPLEFKSFFSFFSCDTPSKNAMNYEPKIPTRAIKSDCSFQQEASMGEDMDELSESLVYSLNLLNSHLLSLTAMHL
jgi:hypothetical protein